MSEQLAQVSGARIHAGKVSPAARSRQPSERKEADNTNRRELALDSPQNSRIRLPQYGKLRLVCHEILTA